MPELRKHRHKTKTMIKNYFKIAWRHLLKDRITSTINILGLALSLAATILIGLYIHHELSYEKGFDTEDQLCRVYRHYENPDKGWVHSPYPLKNLLISTFPEVLEATATQGIVERSLSIGKKQISAKRSMYVDSSFFKTMPFLFKMGNPTSALEAPNTVVLSESIAAALFGKENPLDQFLTLDGTQKVQVKGVIGKVGNTHLARDIFIRTEEGGGGWLSNPYATYVRLSPQTDLAALSAKVTKVINPHLKEAQKELGVEQKTGFTDWGFQPIADIHLKSRDISWEETSTGDIRYVYIFGFIALLLIFLAIFNYTNLSLAQASTRAKEIGIRKVNGAKQGQLQGQFLIETLLQSTIALVLAIAFVILALPFFQELMQIELYFNRTQWFYFLPVLFIGIVVIGLLAGNYPAFMLSRLSPTKVFQNKVKLFGRKGYVQNVLVVAQFIIVATLLTVLTSIHLQVNHMLNQDLGFSGEQVITIPLKESEIGERLKALEATITSNPNIHSMALSSTIPGEGPEGWTLLLNDRPEPVPLEFMQADAGLLDTWKVSIKEGRNFEKNSARDAQNFIVNQAFVDRYFDKNHIPDGENKTPLESDIKFWGADSVVHNIIGVVEDFYMFGVDYSIRPRAIYGSPFDGWYYASFKIAPQNIPSTIQYLEQTWLEVAPNQPMKYAFLDVAFEQQYASQYRLRSGLFYATFLTMFIAFLGLFGLSIFIMKRRQKEIGIRKVLGASVLEIVNHLNGYFLKLVLIALVFALPLGWYLATEWLADYPIRIELEWWLFALISLLVLGVAFITVSIQSVKTATINPVQALRNE